MESHASPVQLKHSSLSKMGANCCSTWRRRWTSNSAIGEGPAGRSVDARAGMGEAIVWFRRQRRARPALEVCTFTKQTGVMLTNIQRYAERFDVDQRHPLVRTLFVPSPVLQNHRLEILIQAANEQSEDGNGEAQMYLVSGLESPTSSAGSYQTITYPVHKALVLAQRLKSTRALLSPRLGSEAGAGEDMILAVVNTPWSSLSPAFEPLNPIKVINLDRAEEAIATFRKSLDNSFHYEHEWFDSGLPQLSTWLIEGTESLPGMVKPTIRRLIETLVANVEEAIQKEEASVMKVQASSVVPQATRDKMNAYLANWAEAAHIELRDKLDRAFSSKQWRKLAWWKLLWRVDDVTSITSDILQRSWLVDADRGILYLAGRIEEAGLLPPSPISTPPSSTDTDASVSYSIENSQGSNPYAQPLPEPDRPDPSTRRFGSPPPNTHLIDLLPLTHPASLLTDHTIPSIAHARNHLLRTTLPPLQSLAQRLLLSSLSLTALTSTLSALVYIATTSTTMFEAGAIAATGAVVAARRLQRGWERGRESWEERVREEGKVVLGGVEGRWREVVGEAGMEAGEGGTKGEGEEERQRARVAVGGVRRELEAMEKN